MEISRCTGAGHASRNERLSDEKKSMSQRYGVLGMGWEGRG